jgi:hypothetical protein
MREPMERLMLAFLKRERESCERDGASRSFLAGYDTAIVNVERWLRE